MQPIHLVKYYDRNNKELGWDGVDLDKSDFDVGTWQKVSFEATAPEGADHVYLELLVKALGVIFVDDAEIVGPFVIFSARATKRFSYRKSGWGINPNHFSFSIF